MQPVDSYAALLHAVSVADCDGSVFDALVVYRYAKRSSDCILTAVAFAYAVFLVVLDVEVEFEHVDDFAGQFGQSVFFHERQNGCFDWSDLRRNTQYDALLAVFEFLPRNMLPRESAKSCGRRLSKSLLHTGHSFLRFRNRNTGFCGRRISDAG